MLRICFPLATLIVAAPALAQPDLSGDWQGAIELGAAQIALVLHLTPTDSGAYAVTMDVPAQGAYRVPTDAATLDGDTLAFAAPGINASFAGAVSADADSIAGTWTQGGRAFPLVLTPYVAPAAEAEETGTEGKPAPKRGDFSGTWVGAMPLPNGGEIRMTFVLTRRDDGTYTAALEAPGQVERLDLGPITVEGRDVTIPIMGQATFTGIVSEDEAAMEGEMTQGGQKQPMTLTRR
jgi:hypothetical protein